MQVEWTISFGVLLQTFSIIAGGLIVLGVMKRAVTDTEQDIRDMKLELKKLAEVVITQAVQTTRIDNLTSQFTMLQRNVEDLRRGNGYVTRSRTSIDGEYSDD